MHVLSKLLCVGALIGLISACDKKEECMKSCERVQKENFASCNDGKLAAAETNVCLKRIGAMHETCEADCKAR